MRGRLGPTAGLGTVLFETSLRNSEKVDPSLKEKEKRWSAIPKKDKKGEFDGNQFKILFRFRVPNLFAKTQRRDEIEKNYHRWRFNKTEA